MPAFTTVATHATGDVLPATDWNTDLRDNIAFLHDRGADLASAANLVGVTNQAHRVTGTTTITAIPAPTGTGQGGNHLLLKFQSAGCAITAGAAIVLTNGPFVSVANGVIELWWDDAAAAWIEIGRVNQAAFQIDYVQITTNPPGISATTEATSTVFLTGNSVVYDGSLVKVEFFVPGWIASAALTPTFVIYRDSTVLGHVEGALGNLQGHAVKGEVFDTPGAGAHIYKTAAYVGANTMTIHAGAGAGADVPAFQRVSKG